MTPKAVTRSAHDRRTELPSHIIPSRADSPLPAPKTKPPLDWVGRGLALVIQRSWVLIINILPSGTSRITSDPQHGKPPCGLRSVFRTAAGGPTLAA